MRELDYEKKRAEEQRLAGEIKGYKVAICAKTKVAKNDPFIEEDWKEYRKVVSYIDEP